MSTGMLLFVAGFVALGIIALDTPASFAQTQILDALAGAAGTSESELSEDSMGADPTKDPLLAIESALADARRRRDALEGARRDDVSGEEPKPSPSLEWSRRLIRVLEQRREAQIRSNELAAGRKAIETALARDPSELFGEPPPFPVPILDGVMQSLRDAADREERHATVLQDHRANAKLAGEVVIDLEKQRRRIRDLREKEGAEIERVRLEAQERGLDDELDVAREQLALADQRVANTTVEHEIKQIATHQARAARAWIVAHLAPRESDLADAVQTLDHERFELDRDIDGARARLVEAEGALRAAEERRTDRSPGAQEELALELSTRRRQLGHRQHLVAMLNQRIERVGRMRTAWRHRYAVLGDSLDLEAAPDWRAATEQELDRLVRNRRIAEAELASLRLDAASLIRDLAATTVDTSAIRRWQKLELEDLETLIAFYQSDLVSLDEAIRLEDQLQAELLARLSDRDFRERVSGAADAMRGFWSFEITASEDSPITPGKILIALFVFGGGYVLARFVMSWLGRHVFPRLGFDSGASNAFASLSFYGFLAIAFLLALRAVNIPLTAFAVVGGALALGIGFGSQAIVSNFISGLLLLAERPIRTGDLIEIGGVVGSVESIGLRSTRIRTADNFHIIVPNASFLESNVINWTHEDPMIRMRIAVGVAYGSDPRKVEALLIQAATEHERTLRTPAPAAYFENFADSALAFELRFWIRYDGRTDRSLIRSEIRFRINELFTQNGIVIAFPQIDVHLERIESGEAKLGNPIHTAPIPGV
jgi:potassium-dependent mechanosensitive channel